MKPNTFAKIVLSMVFVGLLLTSTVSSIPENIAAINRPAKSLLDDLPNRPNRPWVDGTHEMHWREKKQASTTSYPAAASFVIQGTPDTDFVVTVGDFASGVDYPQNFHFVMEGIHCYIYVAYDLVGPFLNYYDSATDEYVFVNPYYPVGGWTAEDRISTAQLHYIMDEFDTNVYPVMTATFGYPTERPAGETKIYLLMLNIRDESYYDSTQTSFVIGYFSSSEDVEENKNMIHFDSYDWANRLGPSGGYDYESTLAHEFEHLIHNDIDSDEESWIDEGCAMMAQYLCGYGHSNTHIYYYFVYHPYTSLIVWTGGLENYGVDYLFMLYLWEHFGGTEFIVDLVENQLNSIDGVVDTLADHGYYMSFDELFHNWAIANYIDDTSIGDGEYGYYTLDIPSRDTRGASVQWSLWNIWVGTELNRYMGLPPPDGVAAYWGAAVPPYTAQYWEYGFSPAGYEATFYYGGDPYAGPSPHSAPKQWYGGAGNWVWRQLHQTFNIPADGATLNFWTNYNIEVDWDYGYVEVHDLTDDTWTTLQGITTTDTLPHEQDNPNTPATREPAYYFGEEKWNAFTGNSGGYIEETMDLTPFKGHSIEIYFVYWTDGAANEVGFFVDDISIPEIGFTDHADNADGWTSEGWMLTSGTDFPNNWQGTVVDVIGVHAYRPPSVRWNLRNGKMTNFQPGTLCNVFEFTDMGGYSTCTIPPVYVNNGHVFTAVFWNGVPYLFSGNYWFFAV